MTETDDVELIKSMDIDYYYPNPSDPEFQSKIYKKREFYYHKTPERPLLEDYNDIKEFRDNICARNFSLHEHQSLLANFINPDTPYKGLLVFHGMGSGKCLHGDTIVYINYTPYRIKDIWTSYRTDISTDKDGGEWSVPNKELKTLSYNHYTKLWEEKSVVHLYREKVNTFMKQIVLENGNSVTATIIHRFFVRNHNRETYWTNNINVGDNVGCFIKGSISWFKVVSVAYIKHDEYVYDLEIQDNHNYIGNGIMCHNTCVGISIAEKFVPMVQKYETKIFILGSNSLILNNWKEHLLTCTGNTYTGFVESVDKETAEKNKKQAINKALQHYTFMTYKSFQRRVIGERIVEKRVDGKAVYRKTEEGEFERDVSVDRIYNLNNTIIIVDEAHNLTNNNRGEALKYIIKNSTNLRVVLLTGTPMKNKISDIVELLNFIRPLDSQFEADKAFTNLNERVHEIDIAEGGIEYIKNMARGYVSHVRGADPLTFAQRNDMGEIPEGLQFTKVIKCYMLPFQHNIYDIEERDSKEDPLGRKSLSVANFVFPGLSHDKKTIIGYHSNHGFNTIRDQIKNYENLLNEKISMLLFGNPNEKKLIQISKNGKSISGKILELPYLKYFSTKFYRTLKNLNKLYYDGKNGPGTAFIYSHMVVVGIHLFAEVLLQNGYLEYQDNYSDYQIEPNTKCYFCGRRYADHISVESKEVINKKSIIEELYDSPQDKPNEFEIPAHTFRPATFIVVTGKQADENIEDSSDEKMTIIHNVFNKTENHTGKYIKFILGSSVMNEGISLKNVKEVHILDAYYNLGRIDQVIGRAIRYCSHYHLMTKDNMYPKVNVYRYVVAVKNKMSMEEDIYMRAEYKYLAVKKVERALKEVAIDCPLNVHANMFAEEIEKHKHCGEPGHEPCPDYCDYTKCHYKCEDFKLNAEYYDPNRLIYKKIPVNMLDYTTFTQKLARDEIENIKDKIKEMYLFKYIYTLDEIMSYTKNSYVDEKRDMFDEFFVFKALDELIPLTENDFNNFNDVLIDKYNRPGYLIYRKKYYIFQPFDQPETVPMYYRTTIEKRIPTRITLYDYFKSKNLKFTETKGETFVDEKPYYDFESVMNYYDSREEYDYVGFIDKELSRRKNKRVEDLEDVFKLREKRPKILDKKRGTGITTLSGSVCFSSRSRKYLEKVVKKLDITIDKNMTRLEICNKIRDRLLELEKYSTGKNKFTYIMIPANHPDYPFPYNLEDRVEWIKNDIFDQIGKVDINVVKGGKKHVTYTMTVKGKDLEEYEELFKKYKATKTKDGYEIIVS